MQVVMTCVSTLLVRVATLTRITRLFFWGFGCVVLQWMGSLFLDLAVFLNGMFFLPEDLGLVLLEKAR